MPTYQQNHYLPSINAYDTPRVSRKFGTIRVLEECLCSMSIEFWDDGNTTPVGSIASLLVDDRQVQSLYRPCK